MNQYHKICIEYNQSINSNQFDDNLLNMSDYANHGMSNNDIKYVSNSSNNNFLGQTLNCTEERLYHSMRF